MHLLDHLFTRGSIVFLTCLVFWVGTGCGQTDSATSADTSKASGASSTNTVANGTNATKQAEEGSEPEPSENPNDNDSVAPPDNPKTNVAEANPDQDGQPPSAKPNAAGPSPENTDTKGQEEEDDKVQVSFKGANIDMIIQWLAETTGKSVVKHPRVQCKLTIVSSKKLPKREAMNLVFRGLAMEGFAIIESRDSILIVPEGEEPKVSPTMVEPEAREIPEGRQRMVKVFNLEHVQASELSEQVKGLLSEKGSVLADQRANKLIVTDYSDNLRLLSELIERLDVGAGSDSIIEIISLNHAQAEEIAGLLNQVLNERVQPSNAPGGNSRSRGPPRPGPPEENASSGGVQASDEIKIWPDTTSNRLVIATPRSRLKEIHELLDVLDVAKPPDVTVRVLPLRNVSAQDLVQEIAPLYQKMSGNSMKDRIEVTANSRSNSLIVLSSQANFEAIRELVSTLDTEQAKAKVLKIFALENADATDVAEQLRELYQETSSNTRYIYYFSRPATDSSEKISVVADRRRNAVLVQASPDAMDRIGEMIEVLDEPIQDDALAPRIFPLKYVSSVDIKAVLDELLMEEQEQRSYWSYYDSQQEDDTVGRLFGKVRITSEPYSNSIIVTSNSQENLQAVEDLLKQLDVPSQAGETTLRVQLKFSDAVKISNHLNILFAKGGAPPLRPNPQQQNQQPNRNPQQPQSSFGDSSFEIQKEAQEDPYFPWLGAQQENFRGLEGAMPRPVSDLIGRVRVVPDPRTSSLLVTSHVHFFPQVIKLVNEMDVPTPQVLIEAKIIEVSSDFRDRLGVRWGPDASGFTPEDRENALLGSAGASYTEIFAGSAMADALRTGVLDASVNLSLLIQFLKKNTESRIVAEPQINISDNEVGRLFVGAQVPFISNSITTDQGGRSDSFQYRDVGVILEVTPHINNDEEVGMKIRVESSNIRQGETILGGAILDTRSFRTDMMVSHGETLVLGGIIQSEDVETIRKTPLLGSIPGLGWAFKKKETITRETELMVFLRPRIIRSPEEVRKIMRDLDRNTPQIQKWEKKNQSPPGDNSEG